jgi:hypothetical protein
MKPVLKGLIWGFGFIVGGFALCAWKYLLDIPTYLQVYIIGGLASVAVGLWKEQEDKKKENKS